jgi:hypothetical protein
MFPTIVGAGLPDHGEVWAREWLPLPTGPLDFAVTCNGVPAVFERSVQLLADGRIHLEYRVKNLSNEPLAFLWAAHPQFVAGELDKITIDGAALEAVTDPRLKSLGGAAIAVCDIAAPGETGKWWNPLGEVVEGISLERAGTRMSMAVLAPHPIQWGLWVDRGGIAHRDVVSPQPALGWHDDLHRAIATGTAALVAPHETMTWSLWVEFLRAPSESMERVEAKSGPHS